jgi:hypothetical protein
VVAGGAGGGAGNTGTNRTRSGGGGGAGGFLTGSIGLSATQTYTVTVGAGGTGGPDDNTLGGNGGNSVFSSITSTGGGGGGSSATENAAAGGSGGGASTTGAGGTGTVGQGNAGANGGPNSGSFYGGGGGGAGSAGSSTSGGSASTSSISGSSVSYAQGGDGGTSSGRGSSSSLIGGGGGGGGYNSSSRTGANGNGGIVIISYPAPQQFGGGVVTTSGSNVIHTFNTSGTLTPLSSLSANYLVVAGGAGGGDGRGGGGGAGGMRTYTGLTIDTNSIYLVTVGAGGAGASTTSTKGASGGDSFFSTITSTGGGGGGSEASQNGNAGGSGGGGSTNGYGGTQGFGGAGNTPSTSPVQGYAGGDSLGTGFNPLNSGAGGGGAGGVGATVNAQSTGGNGGVGATWSVNGVTYAGGGGGGAFSTSYAGGTGGSGIGGAGAGSVQGATPGNGTANTGSGGGGSSAASGGAGGTGGSGVVIISYAGSTQQMAGGTVTISGGNVIHTFTSSGYLTPIKYVNNSLRFRSSASAYLTRTFGTPTNNTKWTWSGWIKRGKVTDYQRIIGVGTDASGINQGALYFDTSSQIGFFQGDGSGSTEAYLLTNAVYRDPAAWYHISFVYDSANTTSANRLLLYVNGVQVTSFASSTYPSSSLASKINVNAVNHAIGVLPTSSSNYFDGYMTEINFVDGQALTPNSFGTFNSYGVWQPITYGGSYGTNGFYLPFTKNTASYAGYFGGSGYSIVTTATQIVPATGDFTIEAMINFASLASYPIVAAQGTSGTSGRFEFFVSSTGYISAGTDSGSVTSAAGVILTNQWYYVALTRSGSNSILYVNGKQVATSSTSFATVQNTTFKIGVDWGGDYISSGYVSNVRVSNTIRTISPATAPTTNFTNDANTVLLTLQGATIVDNSSNAYTLTNNGPVTMGQTYPFAYNIFNDAGPAGNNWTPNNISGVTGTTQDYMNDVPTLTSATAANYAIYNPLAKGYSVTISDGNLKYSSNGPSGSNGLISMYISSGMKTYFEVTCGAAALYRNVDFGSAGVTYTGDGGVISGGTGGSGTFATWTTGDVIAFACDYTAGTIACYKNNTLQTTITGATNTSPWSINPSQAVGLGEFYFNAGQRPFTYTPPSGFVGLNTYNM